MGKDIVVKCWLEFQDNPITMFRLTALRYCSHHRSSHSYHKASSLNIVIPTKVLQSDSRAVKDWKIIRTGPSRFEVSLWIRKYWRTVEDVEWHIQKKGVAMPTRILGHLASGGPEVMLAMNLVTMVPDDCCHHSLDKEIRNRKGRLRLSMGSVGIVDGTFGWGLSCP